MDFNRFLSILVAPASEQNLALELDNDVNEENQDGEEEDSLEESGLALPWIKSE